MLSLKERLDLLERDAAGSPPGFVIHRDLPFAILRYDPGEEWDVRRQAGLLATRLKGAGRTVRRVSLAELLWSAIERSEGLEAVVELEREMGFAAAQDQVTSYLSDPDWAPLSDLLVDRLAGLRPDRDLVFLERAAALAPHLYQVSALLDRMKGRLDVPTVLFYPGALEGTTGLRFMDVPLRGAPLGNYRVKIYG